MKKKLILSLLLLSQSSWSQDQLLSFTEDVRDVITRPEILPVEKFELSKEEADQIKAVAQLDNAFIKHFEEVGKACLDQELKERVEKRSLKIEGLVIASDKKFEQNAIGKFRDNDYVKYMGQLSVLGNKKSQDIYTIDQLISKYKEQNPGTDLDKLNVSEREALLGKFAEKYLGSSLPKGLLMKEMAFHEMLVNSSDWQKTLLLSKDKLSSQQKVELVSKLGGAFNDYYNYSRSGGDPNAKEGFVSAKALLDSYQNGTTGGVCRDIALAQVQFLETLGFKNNYVVAFKDKGAQHATVISVDPVSGKIVKFNYADTTTMEKGAGTEALIQDHSLPDYGLNYKIYDSNGKPVTKVNSELSQMLRTGTNGDNDRIFNEKNYKIAKVTFQKDGVSGNLFTGQTSNGETLYGASINQQAQLGPYVKTNNGIAVAKLQGERSQVKIDQTSLYLLTSVEVSSPSIKHKAGETKAFVAVDGEILMSKNTETKKETGEVSVASKQLDSNMDFTIGVENKFSSKDNKTKVDSKVYATYYPDFNHVASAEKIRPALNQVVVATGVEREISDNTKAKIDTAVIIKKYGTSMIVKAVLQDEKRNLTYKAGVSTPVSKDTPTFLPGGTKRISAGVEKKTKDMVIIVEVERNLDNKSNAVSVKGQGNF